MVTDMKRLAIISFGPVRGWSRVALSLLVLLLFLSSLFEGARAACSFTKTSSCGLVGTDEEPDGCSAGCRLENKGWPSCNKCHECDGGKEALGEEDTSCTDCPPGKATAGSGEPCSNCVAGKYASGGATGCTPCLSGAWSGNVAG